MVKFKTGDGGEKGSGVWIGEGFIPDYNYATLFHVVRGRNKEETKGDVSSIMSEGLRPTSLDPNLYVVPDWLTDEKGTFFAVSEDVFNIVGFQLRVRVPTERMWVDVLSEQIDLMDYLQENKGLAREIYGDRYEKAIGLDGSLQLGSPVSHISVPINNFRPMYERLGDSIYTYLKSIIYFGGRIPPEDIERVGFKESKI